MPYANGKIEPPVSINDVQRALGTGVTDLGLLCVHADTMLSLDYGVTALAGVISVARKVMTHEEDIAALKRRIGELENEIETLKAA